MPHQTLSGARTAKVLGPRQEQAPETGRLGGIQSIERAFAILEEVARAPDGVGLAELGKRVHCIPAPPFTSSRRWFRSAICFRTRDQRGTELAGGCSRLRRALLMRLN